MSRAYEYRYALEAAARRALEESRIKERIMADITRFSATLTDMTRKGYSAYIPEEMQQAKSEVLRLQQLLSLDYQEAREASSALGNYIKAMDTLAESAVNQFHHSEIERARVAKEAQLNLIDVYYRFVEKISNPIVANFAKKELDAVMSDLQRGGIYHTKKEVEDRIQIIINIACQKEKKWKEKTRVSQQKEVLKKQLDEKEIDLKQNGLQENEKGKEILGRIKQLREQVDASDSDTSETINSGLAEIDSSIDEALITEDVRRETVRSIVNELRKQEFIVGSPQIIGEGADSFVRITATKPSGKRAVCQIDLKGKIAYKFDHYEGMTCLTDIEQFNADLQQIYSVRLSDEREIWSNPDRLTKDAYSTSDVNRRTL